MHSWPTREIDLKVAAQFKLAFSKKKDHQPLFITISREYGCDGKDFAQYLVDRLNGDHGDHPWQIFNRESLLKAAEPEDLNEDMLKLLDAYGHSEFQGYIQEAIFGKESQYRVIRNMAKIIRALARRGHVVFLGSGAAVMAKDLPSGLHFRLYAPLEWRVENHARRWQLDEIKARERVLKNQGKREAFLQTYLAESIANPHLYDLMINNARVAVAVFGEMALSLVSRKQKQVA